MKRSRIRPISKRRMKRDAVYQERRRQVYERADGRCEVYGPECTGACEQVHHIEGRLGDDPHRLDNLLGCCASCHSTIHRYPEWARAKGWSRYRLADNEGDALPPFGGDAA